MSKFNVKIYNSSDKNTWNNFVTASNQDTFLFQRDFMDYHSDRFQDFSLMVYKNDTLLAVLPANSVGNLMYSHQGLTYGSLIYAKHLKITDFIEAFKTILEFLKSKAVATLSIKELPCIYLNSQMNNPLQYILFKIKAELIRTDLHSVVELNHRSYSNSRKKGIKRGVKANLKIEESNSFESFWNAILIPNLERKHSVKPVHSLKEIQLLKSRFPKNIRQFNVFYKGDIVGGTTIFETEQVAHCQYISGDVNKNELGSLDFLHHHLMENVFNQKSYFNFGTSNFDEGQYINEGLIYWKEGFGARSIPQGFYNISTKNYKLLEDVLV
jgi:hypothetical protein